MPLIGAGEFIDLVKYYKILWLKGRYGGGKTALAYRLGYELLKSGKWRYLVGNSASVWTEDVKDVKVRSGGYLDTVVILDEAGLFLKTGADTDEFTAGLRKLNVVLLLPSVMPPAQRVRFLTVQRTIRGQAVGLPFWFYQWKLVYGDEKTNGSFIWWRPEEIFGIYDTEELPVDDNGVSDWLTSQKEKLVRRRNPSRRFSKIAVQVLDSSGGSSEQLEAAEQFEQIAERIETVSKELPRRIRRR